MAVQKTTSRKKEEIEKELGGAKKLLEAARGTYARKTEQIKDLELRIKQNEAYLKNMTNNTTANHKVAGQRSRYEIVQAEVARDKKRLEEAKAQKKAAAKDIANKKYYVNRLNNELTLPFKEVKVQVREDSEKGNKAKGIVRSRKIVRNKNKDNSQVKAEQVKAAPTIKPISLEGIQKVDLVQTPMIDTKDIKLKIQPTVTLVPHIKKNGKASKRNFDIQLMDADGKVFTVTEKMANKVFKRDLDNGKKDAYMWPTYVQACKEGRLTPELLEDKFFKGQVNLGDKKAPEVNKEAAKAKMPENQLPDMSIADTGGKGAYDGMATTSSGMPMSNEVNIPAATSFVNTGKPAEITAEDLNNLSSKIKTAQAEAARDAANKAFAKSLENAEMKTYEVQEAVQDPFKKVKVSETTINETTTASKDGVDFEAMQKEAMKQAPTQKQTKTLTPEGISYSFDSTGKLTVNGALRSGDVDHLMPGYEKENSSKQVYGVEAKVTINHAYKDDKGMYHCGGSIGKDSNAVRMQEREILNGIAANNAVYGDLKRESAKRNLSEPEKKFMKMHEDMLQQRGLVRCDDGVLEYKDCPKDQHNQAAHARAQKLNAEILRGTNGSKTTTINQGDANVAQMQMSKGGNVNA